MAYTTIDDFEDGDVNEWTIGDPDWGLRTDRARDTYSGGMQDGGSEDGDPTAYRNISNAMGTTQPGKIRFYMQESGNSYSETFSLRDSNGNYIVGFANDNPQWFVSQGNGNYTQIYGGDGYDRWIEVIWDFDWSGGTYDYTITDQQSGTTRTGTEGLYNNTDADEFVIRYGGCPPQNLDNPNSCGGYNMYCWVDDIAYEGTAVSAPSTPQNLTASVNQDDVTLNWDAVNWNGDQGTYHIARDQNGSPTNVIDTVSAGTTSYNDNALTDGIQYHYRVYASNSAGSSSYSNEDTATTYLPAPTLDSIQTGTEDQLTINWTKTDDNGSDGGFTVYRSQNGSTGSQIAIPGVNDTSYTDTGLEDGERYYYTVSRDTGDNESFSGQLAATTILPGPSGLSVSHATTEGELDMSWTNNDDSSDGDINIYRSTDGTKGSIIAQISYLDTSYTDTGLSDGERYYYTIERQTDHRTSSSNQDSNVTTLPGPTNMGSSVSADDITITWTDNSDNEDGFEIYRSVDGGSYSQIATIGANSTQYTDTGLEDGEEYKYYVNAYTEHTTGTSDTTELATTELPSPTLNPPDASVEDEISLSWSKNDDSPDGDWALYRSQDGSSYSLLNSYALGTTSTTDTGLEDGERYWYYIERRTDHATASSSERNNTTQLPAPSGLAVASPTQDELDLAWSNNDDSSDGDIEVLRSQDGSTGSVIATFTDLTTTGYTDTNLEDGERYYYIIRRNTNHTSASSGQESGITTLPKPTIDSLDTGTEDEITLNWSKTDDNPAGGFRVYASEDGSLGTQQTDVADTTTSYTDTGLEDGERYHYTVERYTNHTTRNSTQQAATTILPTGTLTIADTRADEVDLSWTKNDDSSDGDWEIYRSTDGSLGSIIQDGIALGTASYTDSGLSDGTRYYYTLRRQTDHTSADTQTDTITDVLIEPVMGSSDFTGTAADIIHTVSQVTAPVENQFKTPTKLQRVVSHVGQQIDWRVQILRDILAGVEGAYNFRVNQLVFLENISAKEEQVLEPAVPVPETWSSDMQSDQIVTKLFQPVVGTVDILDAPVTKVQSELASVTDTTNLTPLQLITEAVGGFDAGRDAQVTKPLQEDVGSIAKRRRVLSWFLEETMQFSSDITFRYEKLQQELLGIIAEQFETRIRNIALEVVSRLQKN